MKENLNMLVIHYDTNRKYSELKKELKVRTLYKAVKSWLDIKSEIFKISLDAFYAIAFNGMVQHGET